MSPPSSPCIVVDTNVLATAEGINEDASEHCRAACIQIARRIQAGATIAIDADDLILKEYLSALSDSHSAGIGAKLATSLFRRRYDPQVCRRVPLAPSEEPPGSFEEVPTKLRSFDVDDHKFIAVAAAEGNGPQVFQALDEQWWDRRQDFVESGIDVQFLCAADLMDETEQAS